MGADDTTRSETEQLVEELSRFVAQGTFEYLGRCVVAWSCVERSLEALLVILFSGRGLPPQDAQIVVQNLDVRERAKVAIGLAYQATLPRKRLTAIERLVNCIQNDLRNRRNRLLHDSWSLGTGLVMKRESTGTKLVRPQAWQIDLLVPDYEPVRPATMDAFVQDCLKIASDLADEAQHVLDAAARHLPPKTPLESIAKSPRRPKFWSGVLQRSR